VRELSFKCNIKPQAITSFEKGQKMLFAADKEKLVKTFKEEGVQFLDFGEVKLVDDTKKSSGGGQSHQSNQGGGGTSEPVTYTVDLQSYISMARAAKNSQQSDSSSEDNASRRFANPQATD
jgi:hypothetical protein